MNINLCFTVEEEAYAQVNSPSFFVEKLTFVAVTQFSIETCVHILGLAFN